MRSSGWAEWAKQNPDRVNDQCEPGSSSAPTSGTNGATVRPEAVLQKNVVEWCRLKAAEYPALDYIFSTPNEGKRNRWRDWSALGMRAGVPDLVLPYSSGEYGALYLELKARENDLTPKQAQTIEMLVEAGNAVDVAWTFEQAKFVFLNYLEDPDSFVPGY